MKTHAFLPRIKKIHFLVWLAIAIILLILSQAPSYQYETINWDESTFTIQGADLLRGNLPYIQTLDSKPPFLYANFAAALLIFGKSVISVRLLGDLMIIATALLIYLVVKKLTSNILAAVASWLFISMTAVPFAQYTSSEIVAIFYLMLSIWVLLNVKRTPIFALCAGVLMSLTVLVRTNLALTAIAGALIYIFDFKLTRNKKSIYCILSYISGGIIPILMIIAIYSQQNALEYLELGMLKIPLSYSAARYSIFGLIIRHGYLWLKYIKLLPFIIVPLTTLYAYVIIFTFKRIYKIFNEYHKTAFRSNSTWFSQNIIAIYLVILLIFTLFSILLSGGVYAHYHIQFFPLIIIILFIALEKMLNGKQQQILVSVLSILLMSNLFFAIDAISVLANFNHIEDKFPGREIAKISSQYLSPDDEVLAFDQHISLLYLKKNPIVPIMTHPSNFAKSSYVNVLYNPKDENFDLLKLVLDMDPKLILIQQNMNEEILNSKQQALISSTFESEYLLVETIENCTIYLRIS